MTDAGERPIIVNRQSGTVRSMGEDAARALLHGAFGERCRHPPGLGRGGGAAVRRILASGRCGRIIVGGGDGTVASVAGLLAGTGLAMGILPLGTMNLMAKAIGMSGDLAEALEQLQRAETRNVDAARAGGRLFLHHVSFGIQPRMVADPRKAGLQLAPHQDAGGRCGRCISVLLKPQSQRLSLEIDGRRSDIKAPALIVSNNIYEDSAWLKQAQLDEGLLGVYALKPMSRLAFLRLALRPAARALAGQSEHRGRTCPQRADRVQPPPLRAAGGAASGPRSTANCRCSNCRSPSPANRACSACWCRAPQPDRDGNFASPGRSAPVQSKCLATIGDCNGRQHRESVQSEACSERDHRQQDGLLGVIIALAVIGVLWYYGTRDGVNITNTTTQRPPRATTEPPAATAPVEQAPATQPPAATAPATEPPAATETAPATGSDTGTGTGACSGTSTGSCARANP